MSWLFPAVLLAILDAALIIAAIALHTDRRILNIKSAPRYSLAALLLAAALIAAHAALCAQIFSHAR